MAIPWNMSKKTNKSPNGRWLEHPVPRAADRPAEKDYNRVQFRPQGQRQSDTGNADMHLARKGTAAKRQGRDHEQAHHGGRRAPAKALQPRMLHPSPKQVRRRGSQCPRHEENAQRRHAGPGNPGSPVAQKGQGNEHRPRRHIAEGDRRRKILRLKLARFPDRNTFDERQGRLSTSKGE